MVLAAIGQICSTASMTHNLAQCQTIIRKAVSAGAKALFLPEASDYLSATPSTSLSLCQPTTTSPFIQGLQSLARTHSLPINVGIHEPTTPPSPRLKNTVIWISATGAIVHRYQKLHVFDIDLRTPSTPEATHIKESLTTEPGGEIAPVFDATSLGLGHVGSLICFDVRFPEPATALRRMGADVLLYPSAFTVPTGRAHWEVLLRARAIETQCFVVAAAQCGRHNGKRVSHGESMVVSPSGVVLGRLGRVEGDVEEEREGAREPECLVVDIDLGECERVRRELPLLRRGDVYPLMDVGGG